MDNHLMNQPPRVGKNTKMMYRAADAGAKTAADLKKYLKEGKR